METAMTRDHQYTPVYQEQLNDIVNDMHQFTILEY